MSDMLLTGKKEDIAAIYKKGNPYDSRTAGWLAIQKGSDLIRDIQLIGRAKHQWLKMADAMPFLNKTAKQILNLRLGAINRMKTAPHHAEGYRLSKYTGTKNPRQVNSLCLVSGHKGQEIPALVANDRVVVDVEHMQQALGPAAIDEIFSIRKQIGEYVYISTNVSETPQIVRNVKTGKVDSRSTSALTAMKAIAAIDAGADVIKIGFANLNFYKLELGCKEIVRQMKYVRKYIDKAVQERAITAPRNIIGRYPLMSVFFPEIGIDFNGDTPWEIADKGISTTKEGGWQGVLIDTYEKFAGKKYKDYYSIADTKAFAQKAHDAGMEFWIAGSITKDEIKSLVDCKVDLICFGGAARNPSGIRGKEISRPLVEGLVNEFEKADPSS